MKKTEPKKSEPAAKLDEAERPRLTEAQLQPVLDWYAKIVSDNAVPTNPYELTRFVVYDGILTAIVCYEEFFKIAKEAEEWPEAKDLLDSLFNARDEAALIVAEYLGVI